jgi:hypothetical protein
MLFVHGDSDHHQVAWFGIYEPECLMPVTRNTDAIATGLKRGLPLLY